MKIICGLGNPGSKYVNTRHNAGFIFIDHFWKKHDFPKFINKWGALISEGIHGNEKILLIKPQKFMNLSGETLSKFVNFYKVDLENVYMVYDDVDISLGKIRFREIGSGGTHNGMKSVIQCLGSSKFPRLRLGVESRGETMPEQMDISDFVLSSFKEEEWPLFETSLQEGMEVLEKALA